MALWQFALDPIPASEATIDGIAIFHLTRDRIDAIELNLSSAREQDLFAALEAVLPEKRSWNSEIRIWGDDETDDIQVFFDGDRIEGIQFRIDVRNVSVDRITKICAVARQFDWLLTSRRGAIIQPTPTAVISAISTSEAAKFISDPLAYLQAAVCCEEPPV